MSTKFEREVSEAFEAAAEELGVVGAFQPKTGIGKHHKFRVVLDNFDVVTIDVPCTPRCASAYLVSVPGRLRRAVHQHLELLEEVSE